MIEGYHLRINQVLQSLLLIHLKQLLGLGLFFYVRDIEILRQFKHFWIW